MAEMTEQLRKGQLSNTDVSMALRYPGNRADVTEALFELGRLTLDQTTRATDAIDQKLSVIVAFVGAALTLTGSQMTELKSLPLEVRVCLVVSVGLAVLSVGAAAVGVWARGWAWFADVDWFQSQAMASADGLRRYHLLAMHAVIQKHNAINRDKGGWLLMAQFCVALAAAMIGVAISLWLFTNPG